VFGSTFYQNPLGLASAFVRITIPTMAIYKISRAGKVLGEYDEATLRRFLDVGSIKLHDYGWTEGMTEWSPLHELGFRVNMPSTPVAYPTSSPQAQQAAQAYAHLPHPSQDAGEVSEEKVQLFGYVGAGLLTLGTFGPFMNLGIFSVSILADWNWKGVTVLICGIASALITYTRVYVANCVTAVIPALIFIFTLIKMSDSTRGDDLGGEFARKMISPGWGLFVMCLGIVSLGVCAWMSFKPMKKLS